LFQSLLWWIGGVKCSIPKTNLTVSWTFQSLLWWIGGVKGSGLVSYNAL